MEHTDTLCGQNSTLGFKGLIWPYLGVIWPYLGEVTIIAGQAEIQFFGLIICKNPWENWILVQVIVCPTCMTHKPKLHKHCENIPKVTPPSYIPSRASCKS
jgi:hypothetical protein